MDETRKRYVKKKYQTLTIKKNNYKQNKYLRYI